VPHACSNKRLGSISPDPYGYNQFTRASTQRHDRRNLGTSYRTIVFPIEAQDIHDEWVRSYFRVRQNSQLHEKTRRSSPRVIIIASLAITRKELRGGALQDNLQILSHYLISHQLAGKRALSKDGRHLKNGTGAHSMCIRGVKLLHWKYPILAVQGRYGGNKIEEIRGKGIGLIRMRCSSSVPSGCSSEV